MYIQISQILVLVIGSYYFIFGFISTWAQLTLGEPNFMLAIMIFTLVSIPGILLIIIGYLMYLEMKPKRVKVLKVIDGV